MNPCPSAYTDLIASRQGALARDSQKPRLSMTFR